MKQVLVKRDLTAGLLHYSGLGAFRHGLKSVTGGWKEFVVLAYHRVSEPDLHKDCLDPELISAFPHQFERQIKSLVPLYELLTFEQLLQAQKKGRVFKKPPLIITLDDGYRDNFDIAYPILKRYGVPATIFLALDYIGRETLFWWDRVYCLLRNARERSLNLNGYAAGLGPLTINSPQEKEFAKIKILSLLKEVENYKRLAILAELEEMLAVPEEAASFRSTLSWDEIALMADNGIEFGGHSLSHAVLSKLTDEELKKEIRESKQILEGKLKRQVVSFCYPVGQKNSYDQRVLDELRRAGYRFAATAQHGVNHLTKDDSLQLRRIHVTPQDNPVVFLERLRFPRVIAY